jgi:hypothetical protein
MNVFKFEVGECYECRSICDHEYKGLFRVIARSDKTIIISDGKKNRVCRICENLSKMRNAESVLPLGQYVFAPILSADMKRIEEVPV